jgi:hypothetical protein
MSIPVKNGLTELQRSYVTRLNKLQHDWEKSNVRFSASFGSLCNELMKIDNTNVLNASGSGLNNDLSLNTNVVSLNYKEKYDGLQLEMASMLDLFDQLHSSVDSLVSNVQDSMNSMLSSSSCNTDLVEVQVRKYLRLRELLNEALQLFSTELQLKLSSMDAAFLKCTNDDIDVITDSSWIPKVAIDFDRLNLLIGLISLEPYVEGGRIQEIFDSLEYIL